MAHLVDLPDLPIFKDMQFSDELFVSEEDFAQLVEAINEPPKANEALFNAIQRREKLLREAKGG